MAPHPVRNPVRPLAVGRRVRANISRMTAAVMLLTGGLVGYFIGLPTAEPSAAASQVTPTTTAGFASIGISASTPTPYDWTEQRADPTRQAWGVFAAVEFDDALYLLVFSSRDSPRDRVLWRSTDGNEWAEIPLEFGDAIVDDLDVYEDTLLLSGWLDGAPALWRSQPSPTDSLSWEVTRLGTPPPSIGEIRFLDSSVETEVNSAGEVVVAVRSQSDITPMLLDFAADPLATSVLQLSERPVVAVGGQRIWARVVSTTGEESVHSIELPSTTVLEPASGSYVTDVGLVTSLAMWASDDGVSFESVDLSGLPGVALPYALDDSFATAVEDHSGRHGLWMSPDGSTWKRSDALPPPECGGWESLVIGGPGMLVINDTLQTTCLSTNGVDWEVRHSTQPLVEPPGQLWADGTATGFIALAQGLSDLTVVVSADGHDWRPIEFASGLLGSHAFLVNERIVTNAMTYGPPPLGRHFSVWVGSPATG